jgi:hypothetical protein
MPLSPDDPRHGTRRGGMAHYKAGEKPCERCAPATFRAEKLARVRRGRGVYRLVPIGDEAWRYVVSVPRLHVARLSGVSIGQVDRIRKGDPDKVVRASTRDAILAARRAHVVTAVGVQRRVRALAALGWSAPAVQARCGIWVSTLADLRRREPQFVRSNIAATVTAVYEELSMQVPPEGKSAGRTRYWARRNGYLPPLAWDDIDDPLEEPKGVAA